MNSKYQSYIAEDMPVRLSLPRRRLWAAVGLVAAVFILNHQFSGRQGVKLAPVARSHAVSASLPSEEQRWRASLRSEAAEVTRTLHRASNQRSDCLYIAMAHMWFEEASRVMDELWILKNVMEDALGAKVEPAPDSMKWCSSP